MARSTHPLGSGRDARTSRLERARPLRGARFLVRSTPERLVQTAREFLESEGFEFRADGLAETLQAQGSDWTAVAMEIGDEKRSNRTFWTGLIGDELPFPLPKRFQHVIPPTLVVAASRQVTDGVAELVVFPHASRRGNAAHAAAASTRVTAALDAIRAAVGTAMLSHESLSGIRNDDGCPASQAAVREMLGWR